MYIYTYSPHEWVVCVHVYTCARTYIHACKHKHLHIYTNILTCTCVYVHTHTHMRQHKQTHTHTHTHNSYVFLTTGWEFWREMSTGPSSEYWRTNLSNCADASRLHPSISFFATSEGIRDACVCVCVCVCECVCVCVCVCVCGRERER